MPDRQRPHIDLHMLTIDQRALQPDRCQEAWYRHFSQFVIGKSVLDVGAGSGYGVAIFNAAGAKYSVGVDLLPVMDYVAVGSVDSFDTSSFDVVTAFDVVDHVVEHVSFFADMVRVAKQTVILTTPNYNKHKCKNPYHVREYTPMELKQLLAGYSVTWFEANEKRNIWHVDEIADDSMANDFGVMISL